MDIEVKNVSDVDSSAVADSEDQALTLHRDAELAAEIMLDNEATRVAKLSHENRMLVVVGLTEKLKKAHIENGLDVAELRHKLELGQGLDKEEAYEL